MTKGEEVFDKKEEGDTELTGELDRLMWKSVTLSDTDYRYSSDYETYLFIGTDGSGNDSEDRETYVGNMADVLLLVIVNQQDSTYACLQLNRDTITRINLINRNGTGRATGDFQLCTAHWYGGTEEESCENTVKAVSHMLGGLSIDGYYSISMEDISTLNHAAGGVTVTIEDDFSDIDPTLKMGEKVTLSDSQAVHYVRARQGLGDEENTSRMRRQKQYMESLLAQVSQKSQEDPEYALNIYSALVSASCTDMKGSEITDLLLDMQGATNRGFFDLAGESTTGYQLGDGVEHAEYYLDQDKLVQTMTELFGLEEKE
jgi:LCP family protein required for cell wall assembly